VCVCVRETTKKRPLINMRGRTYDVFHEFATKRKRSNENYYVRRFFFRRPARMFWRPVIMVGRYVREYYFQFISIRYTARH